MFPSNIGSGTVSTSICQDAANIARRHQTDFNITPINGAAGVSTALLLASALAVLLLATVTGTTQHNFKDDVLLDLLISVPTRLYG